MKTILVPTDFSNVANQAFEYALQLADSVDSWIVLFHVLPPTLKQQTDMEPSLADMQRYDKAVQKRLKKNIKVVHKISSGDPLTNILEICEEMRLDMVVMGTEGINGQLDQFIESLTSQVIQLSSIPILAIPKGSVFQPIKHVVFATNFEGDSLEILDRLQEFTTLLGARTSCVHIKNKQKGWDMLQLELFNELYQRKVATKGLTFYLQSYPDMVEGLNEFMKLKAGDILTMIQREKEIIRPSLQKSLIKEMALHTQKPLLTFQRESVGQLIS